MDPLQLILSQVKGTRDPAAGSANELLIQLVRRGHKGYPFSSESHARCHGNVALLLDMEIAVCEPRKIMGVPVGVKIHLHPSVEQTLSSKS